MEEFLRRVVDELRARHACHTVILYGSYARGDHTEESDIDVLGIRETGATCRDARHWLGYYLDAFVYPESILETFNEEMYRIRGGRILEQKGDLGQRLLDRVEAKVAQDPPASDPAEVQVRLSWASKMLGRIRRGDLEGHYRRHWLLFQLLEDYFYLRGLRYEGSKQGFKWMRVEDPATYALFEVALEPGAPEETLPPLVERIRDLAPPG